MSSRRPQRQQLAIAQLEHARGLFEGARRNLAAAMIEAREAGNSLRTISSATGLSAKTVGVMIATEQRRQGRVVPRRLSMDDENSLRAVDDRAEDTHPQCARGDSLGRSHTT
jgi:lambda repressor-like predicted transcriptional regulator